MKRSLLALAVLGAFAGTASAQSSVTLFGVVDLAVTAQFSHGQRLITEDTSQASSSRLGFKGTEDLGGGLSAGFWLEAGMNNNTGTGAEPGGGLGFNRRSTVSLVSSTLGEIRLGHDYAPSFWNTVIFDVYGANGIGEGDNIALASSLGSGAGTVARVNNSVAYFLPSNIGGVYGRVTLAPSEGVAGQKYAGGLIGWAGGPVEVAAAYGATKTTGIGVPNGNDYKVWNVGATYDLGFVKLFGLYNENQFQPQVGADRALKTGEISFAAPIGLSVINGSVTYGKGSGLTTPNGSQPKATQFALQYMYNLSKRTTVYVSGAHISNENYAGINFGGTLGITPLNVISGSDGKSSITGYDVGLRHTF